MTTIARQHIQAVTCKTGWPVAISSRVGAYMVIQESTHSLTTQTFSEYTPGYSLPILSSASGLAYMAFISDAARADIIKQIDFSKVDNPAASIIKEGGTSYFESIREYGYAFYVRNPHTKDPGKTSSIAMPVFNGDEIAGTIALSFFSKVLHVEEAYAQFAEPLLEAQKKISNDLKEIRLFKPGEIRLSSEGLAVAQSA